MGPVLRVVRRGGPGARPLLHPSRGTSLSRGGAIQPSPAPSPLSFSVTDVSIPAYIEYHGTIFYQVHVFAGGNNEWMISHRYSDFYALYEKVSYWLPFSTTATFPKKKTFSWILSSTEEDLRERIICLKVSCLVFLDHSSLRHGLRRLWQFVTKQSVFPG